MLLISEYSYETAFNTRYKQQDYDFFYEMVGAGEHINKVINLHRVYLSLLLSMEQELEVMSDDLSLLARMRNLLTQIKGMVGADDRVMTDVEMGEQWLQLFRFETLNEAQSKSCVSCYLHSIMNERALTPEAHYSDSVYERTQYRFILLYKLTDALRIYHFWMSLEHDFNDTKLIMMCAYIVGICMSAGVTVYMFDNYFKKDKKRRVVEGA